MNIFQATHSQIQTKTPEPQGKTNQKELDCLRKDQTGDLSPETIKPLDTVQIIKFKNKLPHQNFQSEQSSFEFFTADWSGLLCIYDNVNPNSFPTPSPSRLICRGWYKFISPIYSACWGKDNLEIYVGCANGFLYRISTVNIGTLDLDTHILDVRCLTNNINNFAGFEFINSYTSRLSMLAIYSYSDPTIRFFNLQGNQFFNTVLHLEAPATCSAKNETGGVSVFGLSNGKVFVVTGLDTFSISSSRFGVDDITFNVFLHKFTTYSPNIGSISCLAVNDDFSKFAVGSIEGRVAIIKINYSYKRDLKLQSFITFRAHRSRNKNKSTKKCDMFQVNHIMFHKLRPNFILTTGSDSITYFWNMKKKNKSFEFQYGGVPVTSCDIDDDFTQIVYGLGYDWSLGASGLNSVEYKPEIFLKKFESHILNDRFN